MISIVWVAAGSLLIFTEYQKFRSLKNENTKEKLFKLCVEGKVGVYSFVTVGTW